MRGVRINMIGLRFGRLLVRTEVSPWVTKGGQIKLRFNCACDCGNKTVAQGADLRSGRTTSCGCSRRMDAAPRDSQPAGPSKGGK